MSHCISSPEEIIITCLAVTTPFQFRLLWLDYRIDTKSYSEDATEVAEIGRGLIRITQAYLYTVQCRVNLNRQNIRCLWCAIPSSWGLFPWNSQQLQPSSFDTTARRRLMLLVYLQLAEASRQTGLDASLVLLARRSVDSLGVQQLHLIQSHQPLSLLQQLLLPQFCKRQTNFKAVLEQQQTIEISCAFLTLTQSNNLLEFRPNLHSDK